MTSVIIIGAGVAGLSAAATLAASGCTVTILDKARNPGGRCATRRCQPDQNSPWFDFGAQYFTARDPEFLAHVRAQLGNTLQLWRPTIGRWQNNHHSRSDDQQDRYIGTQGLAGWLRNEANELQKNQRISLTTKARVSAVERQQHGWIVTTDNDERYSADALLLTTPPEQAKALLPDYESSISSRSTACWALVVSDPQQQGPEYEALFFQQHPSLNWAANNRSKQSSEMANLWTLHANPQWSGKHQDSNPNAVATALIKDFAAITKAPASAFERVHSHRWLYARPQQLSSSADEPKPNFQQLDATLVLAGDWLAGGRVEGAWLSGKAAAQQLIANRGSHSSD